MCGIVGYIGNKPIIPTVLESLRRLEYRGYDSAGVAVVGRRGLTIRRRVGKLQALVDAVRGEPLNGFAGLGHTRWATHGEPSERNAHPHTDCRQRLAVVHNGIIENYAAIKARLIRRGHRFRSATDTEVFAHLLEEHLKHRPLVAAFRAALQELKGMYALCVLDRQDPSTLLAARCGAPLVIGLGEGEQFLASDVPAFLGQTKRVVYLEEREIAVVTRERVIITDFHGRPRRKQPMTIDWDIAQAQKEGYPHFMLKEIHEQPQAVADTLAERLDAARGAITFDRRSRQFLDRYLVPAEKLLIISCGTAYHAGMVGEYMLEEYAQLQVDVDVASEFRYRGPAIDRKTVLLAITQSGETADTLAGLRLAKSRGAKALSICNVMGSSIARESDAVLYTHAGPEIAVASTKAYTAQLTVLALLTLYLAKQRRRISASAWRRLLRQLAQLPRLMTTTLQQTEAIKRCAAAYARERNFYYLGRRYNYPAALEGALKLKEICPLIHAEGYAAGEMKHGPIALIRKGWPVVCIATRSPVYEKMLSNIQEIRARRGAVIAVASAGDRHIRPLADHLLTVPQTDEFFSPMLTALPLQLLAYEIAARNHCDIDQPPNLAKSVTVE